jgi:hypothetical protein
MRPSGPSKYLEQLIRLRVAAAWNEFDSRALQQGWLTVPVFDADVIKLFLDPRNTIRYIEVLSFGGPNDQETRTLHLALFAKITAEFLFLSQDLEIDGQIYESLWKVTPLLTPGHAEDVATMIQEVEKKLHDAGVQLRRATINESMINKAQAALQQARERCRQAEANRSASEAIAAIADVEAAMPQALRGFLVGPAVEALRFVRLMDHQLIRPLASIVEADEGVLNPPADRVAWWKQEIADAKDAATQRRPQAHQSRARRSILARYERDATTLVQVLMLNEQAAERGDRRRYVLVTGDATLHSLYEKWFWDRDERIPDQYALRHPLQYVPVLNFKAMPNSYRHTELFNELTRTLDNLLLQEVRDSKGYPYSLHHTWIGQGARYRGAGPILDLTPRLDTLGNSWWQAIGVANAFNFRLAIRDDMQRLSQLFHFLTLSEVHNALLAVQHGLIADIGATHLAVGIADTLRTCVAAARHHAKGAHGFEAGRVPLILTSDVSKLIGDRSLVELLTTLAKGGASADAELEELIAKVEKSPDTTAVLLAAAVAAMADKWHAVEHFVNRLIQLEPAGVSTGPSRRERQDAQFLKALALRFGLADHADFETALELLNTLASEHGQAGEHLAELRAVSERAALRLAYFLRSQDDNAIAQHQSGHDPGIELLRTDRDLSEARNLLRRLERELGSDDESVLVIGLQIANNSLEHALYGFLETEQGKPTRQQLVDFLNELAPRLLRLRTGETRYLAQLNVAAARCLAAPSATEREQQRRTVLALAQGMLDEENPIPQLDRDFARYMQRRLAL